MILKNGKRIDGCTDTLPIGTLQPFLGLTPPLGYLVCQGQAVSKSAYPELYLICGDQFGQSTETHFYLPDLRGKTLAGYDENDSAMNLIGKLLGQKIHTHSSAAHTHSIDGHTHTSAAHTHSIDGHTHTSAAHTHDVAGHTHTSAAHSHSSAAHSHSTGNHTLTVAEMPSHTHTQNSHRHWAYKSWGFNTGSGAYNYVMGTIDDGFSGSGNYTDYTTATNQNTGGGGAHSHGNTGSTTPGNTGSTTPGATGSTSLTTKSTTPGATGSTSLTTKSTTPNATGSTSLTTNSTTPDATGSNTNFQPTFTVNWIIKAAMLIPQYFLVENTLTSVNTANALSAAQGKILNDKINSLVVGDSISTSTNKTYSCDYINKLNTYSTTEQRVGTFINGKPIYRMVYTGDIANGVKLFSNIDDIVRLDGYGYLGKTSGDTLKVILNGIASNSPNVLFSCFYAIDNTLEFYAVYGGEMTTAYNCKVILEYTKTTD